MKKNKNIKHIQIDHGQYKIRSSYNLYTSYSNQYENNKKGTI